MLQVRELRCGYGQTSVIDGMNLDVPDGGFVVVIGPNGHGKTTLLRAISGLLTARAGTIRFRGDDITGHKPESIVEAGLGAHPAGRPALHGHDRRREPGARRLLAPGSKHPRTIV